MKRVPRWGLLLCILVFAGWVPSPWRPEHNPKNDRANSQGQNEGSQRAVPEPEIKTAEDRIADYTLWLSIATAALFVVAIGQLVALSRTDRGVHRLAGIAEVSAQAAKAAANETKRSVDAYIDAMRGKMAHVTTFPMDDEGRIDYAFKNIGAGPVVLMEFAHVWQIIPRKGKPFDPEFSTMKIRPTNAPIRAGGIVATKHISEPGLETEEAAVRIGDLELVKKVKTTHDVAIHYRIKYMTILDQIYVCRFTIIYHAETKGYQVHADPAYTYDRRVEA